MDGRVLGFLQNQAREAVAGAFAAGPSWSSLMSCIATQFAFYGEMHKVLEETAPAEREIKCTIGCTACCSQKVGVTIPEAIGIAACHERDAGRVFERRLPAIRRAERAPRTVDVLVAGKSREIARDVEFSRAHGCRRECGCGAGDWRPP